MSVVQPSEPKQGTLQLPMSWMYFFNPMARDREISVSVTGLPCVAGKADSTRNIFAL